VKRLAQLRPRGILLLLLAGWGVALSVETWFRPPGWRGNLQLPLTLRRAGRVWPRRAAPPPVDALPESVTLLEQAAYGPFRLALVGLSSSGTGVHMPVEAIGPALLGPGGKGRCVVLADDGAIQREMSTAAAWREWMASQPPRLQERIAWLSGLRPYRANVCLWEGGEG
jgi:hypothetical protein